MRYHIFSKTSREIRDSWTCEKCGFEVHSHSTPYYVGNNLMLSIISGSAYNRVSCFKSPETDCNYFLTSRLMLE